MQQNQNKHQAMTDGWAQSAFNQPVNVDDVEEDDSEV